MVESLARDLALAARTLRRHPGYTAAAVLSLALGIGANTAVFSLLDAFVLQPLPYPEPDRLVRVYEAGRLGGRFSMGQRRGAGPARLAGTLARFHRDRRVRPGQRQPAQRRRRAARPRDLRRAGGVPGARRASPVRQVAASRKHHARPGPGRRS